SLALPRTRTKALAQEEIDWLRQRNRDAIAAGEKAANDAVDERKSDAQITAAGRRARDNSLVESTRKRTEELKSALAIARHGGK
ncbi:MAG TPA: hypothetical protein VG733_10235, partial [Chthoniobacteraceae bacterium]|nr:hypothetical protein [Chthoniobacteraceae bacterium]